MNTLVGAGPLIGTGSLDGFAIGALVSGACFLAITSPRRTRRRRADVARAGMAPLTAARSSWLREHVMATEHSTAAEPPIAGGHAVAGERRFAGEHRMAGELRMAGEHRMTGGADEERLALPEELGGPGAGLSADGRGSRAAGYRSRHRAGDPIPGSSARGGAPRRGMLPVPGQCVAGQCLPGQCLPGQCLPGQSVSGHCPREWRASRCGIPRRQFRAHQAAGGPPDAAACGADRGIRRQDDRPVRLSRAAQRRPRLNVRSRFPPAPGARPGAGGKPGYGQTGGSAVRAGRIIWRRRVAFLLPSAFSIIRASSQCPYSAWSVSIRRAASLGIPRGR